MSTLVFQHPERLWPALAILVLVAVLLWRGLRSRKAWSAAALLATVCKLAAAALLALLLTDPVWSRRQPMAGENEVVILADDSASMNVAEKPGGRTRGEQVRDFLGRDKDGRPAWMNELELQFRLNLQRVHERLEAVTDFSGLSFQGTRSELHRAIGTLLAGGSGGRTAAVVLVTDGLPTDAEITAAEARKVPVFPVITGDVKPSPDLAILEHSVTQAAFEDTPVTVSARIGATGFSGREAVVLVLDESGRAVVTEKVGFSRDDEARTVRLKVPAVKPGISFYRLLTLEAGLASLAAGDAWKPRSAEAVLTNNEHHLAVDRGSGPYRVLYLSGRPNWEYKFMRRALAGDPEVVQLPSLIRIARREPKFEWRGRAGETSNPLFRGFGEQGAAQRYDQPVLIRLGTRDPAELAEGFPKSAEQMFAEYRAVVLDDIEAEFFTQEQMNLIERFVSERGGALLTLGGQECYQQGGYEHTPVGRMLPVYLDRTSSQPALENARFDLTREGWLEPWARLRGTREQEEARLAGMPGFFSVHQTFSIKPGASVLATLKAGDDRDSTWPALAAQRFGEGRVVSVTIADLWRWGMRDEQTRADFEKSWRQLMRWLVVDVPDKVQLTATPAAGICRLEVRVRDGSFQPQDDALVRVEVTGPDGRKSEVFAEPSLKEAGLFEAEYHSGVAGGYRAEARVQTLGPDGTASSEVVVRHSGWVHDPLAAELAVLRPGLEWAQKIAQRTGGRVLSLQDLPRLPEILKDIRAPLEETLTTPLWHTPWFFGLVLALLGAEWFLRRRGGLS